MNLKQLIEVAEKQLNLTARDVARRGELSISPETAPPTGRGVSRPAKKMREKAKRL